jgi:hypothetical protein
MEALMDSTEVEIYKQTCEDFRFYGEMRFKQLTLWSVGVGFMLNALYGKASGTPETGSKDLWYLAAFFWTAVIWVMEVRSSVHGVRRLRLKSKLEKAQPDEGCDDELSNKWTLLNATNAVVVLYVTSCSLCVVRLAAAWGPCVAAVWGMSAGLMSLVAFTLREYWPLLRHAIRQGRL